MGTIFAAANYQDKRNFILEIFNGYEKSPIEKKNSRKK